MIHECDILIIRFSWSFFPSLQGWYCGRVGYTRAKRKIICEQNSVNGSISRKRQRKHRYEFTVLLSGSTRAFVFLSRLLDDSYLLYVKFFHQAPKFVKTRNFQFVLCESAAEEFSCQRLHHRIDFLHRLKSQNYVQNKQYLVKVLLKRFHLNGHTIGFHPQTLQLGLHTKQIVPCERSVEEVSFEWSHHRVSSINSEI